MDISIAREFLTRCFAPGDTIAVLLRRESPASTTQRIVALEKVLASRCLAWLVYDNANGSNVYVAANPLRSGSRKRTKESIANIRHQYLDIDIDGEARVAALGASNEVSMPTAIIGTSQGKYQVLWRVEGFDFATQEQTLKRLALAFGGDPACTDCNRVIRVPGFHNRKYEPALPVTVEYDGDSIAHLEDFPLSFGSSDAVLPLRGIARQVTNSKQTQSEQDWTWVISELTTGKDAAQLTQALAFGRADKPNPLYYAQRTVDVASARLWLIEGIRIDDVITMLESRRRFELPTALCSARAQEIAATAQRMIARRKIA